MSVLDLLHKYLWRAPNPQVPLPVPAAEFPLPNDESSAFAPFESVHQARARFLDALLEEQAIGEARFKDYRYDPWPSGRNVGHWELIAVRYARGIQLEATLEETEDVDKYVSRLLRDLESVKTRFRALEEDDDGFGIGTLHALSRKMRERAGGDRRSWPNVDRRSPDNVDRSPFDAFLPDLRDGIARLLRENESLLAFDFGQLYIFALALHLFRTKEDLTDEETLHYTKRLLDARSILVRAMEVSHAPKIVLGNNYRLIAGLSNVLAFLQREIRLREQDDTQEDSVKLPFVPFGASWQKAQAENARRDAKSDSVLVAYNEDIPHYHIYIVARRLSELATSSELRCLARMFPRSDDISFGPSKNGVLFHWLAAGRYSEAWSSEQGGADLFCFRVECGSGPIRIRSWNAGPVSDVEVQMQIIGDAARRAALVGRAEESSVVNDAFRALSRVLWPPQGEDVASNVPLTVIAEGSVALIPIAALTKPSNVPWCRDHPITLVCRPFLTRDTQSQDFLRIGGAIVANPDLGAFSPYPALPEAAREADAISGFTQWPILSGKQASVENTLEALRTYPVVHIATHGTLVDFPHPLNLDTSFADPVGFFRSARAAMDAASILLAGDKGVDTLSASDLAGVTLNTSELVFLSLCRGSSGMAVGSEAPFSIARALLTAGSKRVVASLYPIDDTTACEAAIEFHSRLRCCADPAEALRQTQLALIERGHQWHVWGGYQLVC